MRISVSYPKQEFGFSLPELLVVLAIVSLTIAMVMPNLQGLLGVIQRDLEKKQVVDLVNNLGNVASSRGLKINRESFGDSGLLAGYFPEGWSVVGDFAYLPNGACIGGNISIAHFEKKTLETILLPPFCKISYE